MIQGSLFFFFLLLLHRAAYSEFARETPNFRPAAFPTVSQVKEIGTKTAFNGKRRKIYFQGELFPLPIFPAVRKSHVLLNSSISGVTLALFSFRRSKDSLNSLPISTKKIIPLVPRFEPPAPSAASHFYHIFTLFPCYTVCSIENCPLYCPSAHSSWLRSSSKSLTGCGGEQCRSVLHCARGHQRASHRHVLV
jgi:hypothetical protein